MRAMIFALVAGLPTAAAAGTPPDLDGPSWEQLAQASREAYDLPDIRDADRFRRADYWEVADADGGDCEDKALHARAALLRLGWPASSLRLALGWTETREYHAVLTIDVVRHGQPATYVIDSRFPWVIGWDTLSRFGYHWDRRQAAAGGGWTRIAGR